MVEKLSDYDLQSRLDMVEAMMAKADSKDLPNLNKTFERLLNEQVRRDINQERIINHVRS